MPLILPAILASLPFLGAAAAPQEPTVDQRVDEAAAAVATALDEFLDGRGSRLKAFASADGRLQLYSDFSRRDSLRALERSEGILARLDGSLGAPPDPGAALLRAVLVKRHKGYQALCDVVAAADPAQAGFMEASRATTGFTLYRPPITVYFHDPKVQKEARPDHSVAHNLVHLELTRRYGQLPLWLKEGLACAGEEGAFGEVWAPWYRDGFVFSKSHGAWRDRARELAAGMEATMPRVFRYPAKPYEDDLAHLAFAFATWCLEEQPEALKSFLAALQAEYALHWKEGGRFQPDPALVLEFAGASFGADWRQRLQDWWSLPPPEKSRSGRR
ncbi:MAG: hypothetical protein ISR76_03510 [Planctomycetes bacterium]|nr:hypothetical protein [Planctomycetota bacterium]